MIDKNHDPRKNLKHQDIFMNLGLQDILLRHWLFGCLPGNVIANLSDQFSSRRYSKGTYIFHQNDKAEFLFVILDGEISIENVDLDGKLTNITHLHAGEIFGEFAIIDGQGRSAATRVVQESVVASLPGTIFKKLLTEHTEFSQKLLKVLVSRVRATNQQMECFITLSLMQRTARLLLNLANIDGTELHFTQSDLGDRLHASREKVNSKLKELEKMGLIKCGRGKITILKPNGLSMLLDIT